MANVSSIGQALSLINSIKEQQSLFSDLSTQLGTGRRTQKFSGLGTDVLTTQRARADIRSIENYERNIANASRRLQLTTGAISSFKEQSDKFYDIMVGLSQESDHQLGELILWDDPATPDVVEAIPRGYDSSEIDVDFNTVRDFAGSTYDFLSDLINTRDGERYLFGGAETLTQPLTDTGTLDAAITTMLTDWKEGNITNEELIANIVDRTTANGNADAITDSLIGYNSTLSSGNAGDITIRIDDNTELEYTTLANEEAFRDILVVAAVLQSPDFGPIADEIMIDQTTGNVVVLNEGAPGTTTDEMRGNFFEVYNALAAELNTAIETLDNSSFDLENTRARVEDVRQDFTTEKNLLNNVVGDIENVDLNEVAVELQVLQTQLSASYRVSALLQDLTLANFLRI